MTAPSGIVNVLVCSIHERVFRVLSAPSPCPSPGARGSTRLPLPRIGRGSGWGWRMCSRIMWT